MKVGDCCDIVEILSTAERDFFIRNNGDKVKIESLRGKTICIYFAFLLKERDNAERSMILTEVYNELSPKGEFEVVFVAAIEDGRESPKMKKQKIEGMMELFNNTFSKMPWLSIPVSDVETSNNLCKLFSMPHPWGSDCVILDPNGKVLDTMGSSMLLDYGAEGFPFNDERIEEIHVADAAIRENLSLKSLLVSSKCDFVINNKHEKVPISELEGKVVGLYIYECERRELMQQLVEVYNKLKEREQNFEIVLINVHFLEGYSDPKSFQQNLKEMPWLALPFMDERCRKVWRIFGSPGIVYTDEGILVIIGPYGKFSETYGSVIVEKFGIDAYPFTQKKVVEIEKERLKKVTLEKLFHEAKQEYVIKRNGAKIPVSNLKGKSILIYSPRLIREQWLAQLPKLKEWYNKIKEKDETFEVIYVSSDQSKKCYEEVLSEMPWLAFPYDAKVLRVFIDLLGCGPMELVAFGSDGHIVTKEALQRLQDHGVDAYPFTQDKLDEEILRDLSFRYFKYWGN